MTVIVSFYFSRNDIQQIFGEHYAQKPNEKVWQENAGVVRCYSPVREREKRVYKKVLSWSFAGDKVDTGGDESCEEMFSRIANL